MWDLIIMLTVIYRQRRKQSVDCMAEWMAVDALVYRLGPTSLENWRGCLSVRVKYQLDSENNLCMYPVKEVESLISQTVTYTDMEIGEKAIKLYDDPNRSNRINFEIRYY